jgi:signal recognition particle GTPase
MKQLIEENIKKKVKGVARKKVQQIKAIIDKNGAEEVDSQPIYADIGFKQPPTINERIRQITAEVQAETAAKLAAENMSEEEVKKILDDEDDYEIPDEFDDRLTSYELEDRVNALSDDVYIEEEVAPEPEAKKPTKKETEPELEPEEA